MRGVFSYACLLMQRNSSMVISLQCHGAYINKYTLLVVQSLPKIQGFQQISSIASKTTQKYPTSDSDRDFTGFESVPSANWGSRAYGRLTRIRTQIRGFGDPYSTIKLSTFTKLRCYLAQRRSFLYRINYIILCSNSGVYGIYVNGHGQPTGSCAGFYSHGRIGHLRTFELPARVAAPQGFEPRPAESESDMLPLHYRTIVPTFGFEPKLFLALHRFRLGPLPFGLSR